MRDIFLLAFLLAILFIGIKRPFLFILTYCYVDIVAPQRISFTILPKLQLSLLCFALAVLTWVFADKKRGTRVDQLQIVIGLLLLYCGLSTIYADFPVDALDKWGWVWKAVLWSMFLPLTLTTRLRIEALALTMVLSVGTLVIDGGMKTALGGSGYGSLQIFIPDNSGLFEGSIISTVAISIIPLTIWLAQHGTIFRPSRYVWAFAICLIGACLLIPVGTQARTGLVCAAMLVMLGLRDSRHKTLFIGGTVAIALIALPLLPSAFASRMNTIGNYQSDESASTRVAVWSWTWNHVLEHPFGSGFEMYRQNQLQVDRVVTTRSGGTVTREVIPYTDRGRAFHNSYFEMLGEQGFPGLGIWLYIQLLCLWRSEKLRRRYRGVTDPDQAWIRPLASALQGSHCVFLLGSMFVGIAFQPFVFMLIALQIALWTYLKRREEEARWRPIVHEVAVQLDKPARRGGSQWRPVG
jgi:probable O-glycosylation ligase (exosortase A-associated)